MFEIYNDRLMTHHGSDPSGYIFMEFEDLVMCESRYDMLELIRDRLNEFIADAYDGKNKRAIYIQGFNDGLNSSEYVRGT